MTGPMGALALACIGLGLLPIFVLPAVLRVAAAVAGGLASGTGDAAAAALAGDPAPAAITSFALALALGLVLAWSSRALAARVLRAPARSQAPTWGCGYALPTVRMQYTASSFAAPLMVAFRSVAGVRRARGRGFVTHASDPVLDRIVLPAWHGLRAAAGRLRPIQRGRVGFHLLYIAAALTLLLLYLVLLGPHT
jgi:hydrogenase-4 component B